MCAHALNYQASECEAEAHTSEYDKAPQCTHTEGGNRADKVAPRLSGAGRCVGSGGEPAGVCVQALEEQAAGCEAGARACEGREAAASVRADALKQGIAQMWERLGCQALGLEELLGDEGITDANLMQHLGIIEQRASQLLQVLRCPGGVMQRVV